MYDNNLQKKNLILVMFAEEHNIIYTRLFLGYLQFCVQGNTFPI